ncbi:phage major capsid protein [Phycicoccus sp. KQZ13P-1]|uniref:phage major capsid protein n=1 Tax=Phycicoccus mangrovi TaxID=2840470 RepID=UPI001BFFE403|nr:phage major capsid protein [Phycicoccus mangrovi]MBT9255380.1 phage major capsid protein [Phycicoccus mangrovi]
MTLAELITAQRATLQGLLAQRQSATDALTTMRAALDGDTPPSEADVTAAVTARDAFDPQIEQARARLDELERELERDNAATALAERIGGSGPVEHRSPTTVTQEPEVYRRHGEQSYFRDLWNATAYGRRDAVERLVRNDAQVAHAIRTDSAVAQQMRAIGTADGAGGEFVPPVWLVNEFERKARPARVAANLVGNEPLPQGTDSISLPLVTGGSSTAEQTTQGNALSETDMTTSSATSTVATIGGVQTVNLQLVEQSPINIDTIVLDDLAADYAVRIDTFVLANNATGKKGLLSVAGNAITYTDATPTVPEIWPKMVDSARQIHTNRFKPARAVLMTPTRWAWFQAQLDANGRPYVSDDVATALPLLGITNGAIPEGLAGTIRGLSLPVFLDANIPANLGAGTNEDRILTLRPEDFVLYESARKAEAFRETKAKEAQVVFRLYGYAAFMSERAPKSVSVISGTGLVQPTF